MKVLLCLAFLLAAAIAQKCFDEELVNKDVMPLMDKCKKSIDGLDGMEKEERREKINDCCLKEINMLTADGKLDYEKYKKEFEKYVLKGMESTVCEAMNKVWAAANQDYKVFFKNIHAGLKEACPDDKCEWEEAI